MRAFWSQEFTSGWAQNSASRSWSAVDFLRGTFVFNSPFGIHRGDFDEAWPRGHALHEVCDDRVFGYDLEHRPPLERHAPQEINLTN
jgi:hypothetical protein